MKKYLYLSISFFCLTVAEGHKFEPINSEYAPPVEVFILDITPQYLSVSDGERYQLPSLGLEIPLNRWAQFELGIPYLAHDGKREDARSGFGDLRFGFRAQMAPQAANRPALAFNFEIVAPTGRDAVAGEATELAWGLFATHEFQRWTLFGNISYAAEFPRHETGHEDLVQYAAAAVYHPSDLIHPVVETFGESNLTTGDKSWMVAPELILNTSPLTEVKVAFPIGLTESSPNWGIQFELTVFLTRHPDSNLPKPVSKTRSGERRGLW